MLHTHRLSSQDTEPVCCPLKYREATINKNVECVCESAEIKVGEKTVAHLLWIDKIPHEEEALNKNVYAACFSPSEWKALVDYFGRVSETEQEL